MAGDERDAAAGELVGDGHGLLRIAGVVADLEDQLLAVDAAGGVDVLDRLLGAGLHLLAEGRVLAGHRAGVAMVMSAKAEPRSARCKRNAG